MKNFGPAATIYDLNPFQESSVQQHQLGAKGETGDGRIFRYAYMGEAIDLGCMTVAPAINATLINAAVTATAPIGATSVTFTMPATTATANEYAEGYAIISYGTGIGQTLRVASHAAWTSAETGAVVKLIDPVQIALATSSSKIEFAHNPYRGVMMTASSVTTVTGGALMTFTSGYYGWLQTRGVFGARADSTITAGYEIVNDGSTAGDVSLIGTYDQEISIGHAIQASASGYHHPVFLTID
jgi:hypothetical protein